MYWHIDARIFKEEEDVVFNNSKYEVNNDLLNDATKKSKYNSRNLRLGAYVDFSKKNN
jgi:hypothetical protein